MNLLDWFVLCHLVGDYLLQTEFEAMNKASGRFWNRAILSHCFKYALCFVPITWFYGLNWLWLAVIWGTHMLIDRRQLVLAWRKYIAKSAENSIKNTFWLTIVIDQIFHFIILALIAALVKT